jgi:hypothetical protein
MSRRAAIGERCVGTAVLAALSCARFGYEPLPGGPLDPVPNVTYGGPLGGGGEPNDGGSAIGGSAAGGAASASGTGGAGSSMDAGDIGGTGGVDAGDSNGGTGGSTLGGCEPAAPTATWAFTSDAEGWQLEVDPAATGNLSWTATTGDPAPGALELDATINSQGNARVYLDQSPADFTGKVIYARVFLEGGSGVTAKAFVQSGSSLAWADGYEVRLNAREWHCMSIDLQDPDVSTPGFDRTDVRRIGVFIFGDASPRVYFDQITY